MDNYINKKELSEEDIKNRFITPAINNSGWGNEEFRMELRVNKFFTDGKISLAGHQAHREKPKFADYVLYTESNYPIAVIEAKDNKHTPLHGLQQAMDYAVKLDIPFAYSSNGDSFVEHDFLTGTERNIPLEAFPRKEELIARLAQAKSINPDVKYFSPVQPITNQPYYSGQGMFEPRYYQRIAINRTLNAVANGQNRILLVMATGTGKTYTAFQIIYRLLKSGIKRKILYLADRNILVDRQAVLKEAFEGELTKKWRIEKKITDNWTQAGINELIENDKNALKAGPFGSSLKKECYTKSGYKIYGQEQVIAGDEEIGDYYIGEEKYQELITCKVKPQDVLISLVGTVGKVLVLSDKCKAGIINPRLIKVSLDKYKMIPMFFKYYFESSYLKSLYKEKAHGATMDVLNKKMIQELPFPWCPINEQLIVVQEIESRLSVCDSIEKTIDTALQEAEALRQSILKQAFRGGL